MSYDTTGWYRDHFLMLGDKRKQNGFWAWCGPTCTRHYIEISSEVDQYVFITAHTWEDRSVPRECRKSNKVHSIYKDGAYSIDMFKSGSKQMAPQRFKAGEKNTFIVEFDWQRECITPDWSVVAWAEKGRVLVKHRDGIKSDQMPHIERKSDAATEERNEGGSSEIN